MSDDDDDDDEDLGQTIEGHAFSVDPTREIHEILHDLDRLLKNGDVAAALADSGINASLALLGSQALAAYLLGHKQQAAEDFLAVSEEISDRIKLAKTTEPKLN